MIKRIYRTPAENICLPLQTCNLNQDGVWRCFHRSGTFRMIEHSRTRQLHTVWWILTSHRTAEVEIKWINLCLCVCGCVLPLPLCSSLTAALGESAGFSRQLLTRLPDRPSTVMHRRLTSWVQVALCVKWFTSFRRAEWLWQISLDDQWFGSYRWRKEPRVGARGRMRYAWK